MTTVMALGIDIHPYAAKVRIYGELIQGKKPHKGFDFVWGISFPDGVEEVGIFISILLLT